MIDESIAASRLFGDATTDNTDTSPPTANVNTPRTDEQMQDELYGGAEDDEPLIEVPADVQAIRNSQERRMFSAQETLREAIAETDFIEGDAAPATTRQIVRELREIAADLDLGPKEIATIKDRVNFVKESKPDIISQREAAMEVLNQEFGQGAAQALQEAQALIGRDPRAAKVFEIMGVGDDPEVVLLIARAARTQRGAGKLK